MGAVPRFEHPNIWSPAGGYWAHPAAWKRNTAIAFGAVAVVGFAIARWSWSLERRENKPTHGLVFGDMAKNLLYKKRDLE
jgi:hypothetical protein